MIKHKNQLITSDKVFLKNDWITLSKRILVWNKCVQAVGAGGRPNMLGSGEKWCPYVLRFCYFFTHLMQQLHDKTTTITQVLSQHWCSSDRDPPLAHLPVYIPGSLHKWSECIFMWLLLFITCKMAWDTLMHAISTDNDNQDSNYTKSGSSITVTYHLNNQT